jgi:hypothetical protein
MAGNGALKTSGLGSNSGAREAIKIGFDYFKANVHRVSWSIKAGDDDYHLHVVELHNSGPTTAMTLATFYGPPGLWPYLAESLAGRPSEHQVDIAVDELPLGGNAWMLVDEEAGHVTSKHGYLREIDPVSTRCVLVHLHRARQFEPREADAFAESSSTTEQRNGGRHSLGYGRMCGKSLAWLRSGESR